MSGRIGSHADEATPYEQGQARLRGHRGRGTLAHVQLRMRAEAAPAWIEGVKWACVGVWGRPFENSALASP